MAAGELIRRYDMDNDGIPYGTDVGQWCRLGDVELLENALRAAVKALNRACRHDDPDNSGLCVKCGVVLEADGPIFISGHGVQP